MPLRAGRPEAGRPAILMAAELVAEAVGIVVAAVAAPALEAVAAMAGVVAEAVVVVDTTNAKLRI